MASYNEHQQNVNASLRSLPSNVTPVVNQIMAHASQMQMSRLQHIKAQATETDPGRRAAREQEYQQYRQASQARSADLMNQAQQAMAAAQEEATRRESIMSQAQLHRAAANQAYAHPLNVSDLSGLLESAGQ